MMPMITKLTYGACASLLQFINLIRNTSYISRMIFHCARCKMSSQQRRKSYTDKFKLQVITWYHENESNAHATAKHFDIQSVVIDLLATEDLLKKAEGPETTRHIHVRECKARYSALDGEIIEFLSNERNAGRSVSN